MPIGGEDCRPGSHLSPSPSLKGTVFNFKVALRNKLQREKSVGIEKRNHFSLFWLFVGMIMKGTKLVTT